MKFKCAALVGCGVASLLTDSPASAQVTAFSTADPATTRLISGDALAAATPLTLNADMRDAFVAAQPALSAEPMQINDVQQNAARADAADEDSGWLSEFRLGLLAQDRGPIVNDVESGAAVNAELLFNSPRLLDAIGSPRPHLGISAATDPDATSYAYAGLTWEYDFQQHWFLVGGLGLAIHNGETLRKSEQNPDDWGRVKTLGCRVDFHWGIGAGRRLSEDWNVALHYEHVSSGDVCIKGALGLENVGIRFGRLF